MISQEFLNRESLEFNKARLEHLHSLGLPIEGKTINEYGSGPGLLTPFFLLLNCKVTSYEGREENVSLYRENIKNTDTKIIHCNLEEYEWPTVTNSQIGFAYGVLYHLDDPVNFIQNIAKKTHEFVIVETVVILDTVNTSCVKINEEISRPIQSLSGNACRPSRKFIWDTFHRFFPYVYVPKTQPNSSDFPLQFESQSNHTHRFIIIGSKQPIVNPNLSDVLLTHYTKHI